MATSDKRTGEDRPLMAGFYLYEHRRVDSGMTFYVGKGCGDRAKSKQGRNAFWRRVVARAGGYSISIVAGGMTEDLAYLAEAERINQLRRLGVRLCNLTEGGEGMTGHKHSAESKLKISRAQVGKKRPSTSAALKGVPKSEAHREALSKARIGKTASAETRAKLSRAQTGRPSAMLGKRHRPESRAKISAAMSGSGNPFYGRRHGEGSRLKMSMVHAGVQLSSETKRKMSESRKGEKNPRFGVRISEEQKQRQIAALRSRPRVTCPYCAKVLDESNAKRWHFDNCKRKV